MVFRHIFIEKILEMVFQHIFIDEIYEICFDIFLLTKIHEMVFRHSFIYKMNCRLSWELATEWGIQTSRAAIKSVPSHATRNWKLSKHAKFSKLSRFYALISFSQH